MIGESKMKKILLIGDSIRMGYDKYVKEALAGEAEVYYPDENSRFALYVLRYAHEWRDKTGCGDDVDAVHWNAGLWDCLELFGDDPMTDIEFYERLIARVDKRLRMLFPGARMIFATSTAVLEEKCSEIYKRHNAIIEKYNEAAKRALAGTDTLINDLYALSAALPEEYHSDATHYNTDGGRREIGNRVLSYLCGELGISAEKVNLESFVPENYSKDNIGF